MAVREAWLNLNNDKYADCPTKPGCESQPGQWLFIIIIIIMSMSKSKSSFSFCADEITRDSFGLKISMARSSCF